MTEILRLRKKIEDLQANTKSSTTLSEDVTLKPPVRPQGFAPHTTQFVSIFCFKFYFIKYSFTYREPVISRVVPMAPATGRQIGVATPMTASTTATTTSTPLWTAGSTTVDTSGART